MNQVEIQAVRRQQALAILATGTPVHWEIDTPGTGGAHKTRGVCREPHYLNAIPAEARFPAIENPPPVEAWPDVPAEPPPLSAGAKAERFLLDRLAVEPLPALQVQAEAKQAGIKPKTLRNAREKLGVAAQRHGRGAWFWHLPVEGDLE